MYWIGSIATVLLLYSFICYYYYYLFFALTLKYNNNNNNNNTNKIQFYKLYIIATTGPDENFY